MGCMEDEWRVVAKAPLAIYDFGDLGNEVLALVRVTNDGGLARAAMRLGAAHQVQERPAVHASVPPFERVHVGVLQHSLSVAADASAGGLARVGLGNADV